MSIINQKHYSKTEDLLNVWSHLFGLVLSIIGTIFLLIKAYQLESNIHWITYSVFGVSMMIQFAASSLYHGAKDEHKRILLKVFDHVAIYLLIAGTYTPYSLLGLKGAWGWSIFTVIWIIAIAGVILKLFYTGQFKLLSTISYILMGWVVAIAIKPLLMYFPVKGLYWLLAGGLFYTIGAIIYSLKRIPFNHAIFHFFVLFGAFALYWGILIYT